MARLALPESTVRPQQGSSGRRASAGDMGTSLAPVARGLADVGEALHERQQKKEAFDVQRDVAQAGSDILKDMERRQTEAPLGAPDFTKKALEDFDTYSAKMIDERRKAGYSEAAIDKFSTKLAGLRLDVQEKSMAFEARSRGAKAKVDTETSLTNYSQRASMDPNAMGPVEAEWSEMVDALPVDAITRESIKTGGQKTIRESAGLGLARQNPGGVIASLTGGATVGGTRESYYASIKSAESGGVADAKNPRSSATGLYQFTTETWNDLIRENPAVGLTPDGRTDPLQQEMAIRLFTDGNAALLEGQRIAVTNGNLYATHFLGRGDGPKVLKAPDTVQVASLVSADVMTANPHLAGMTVGDFKVWAAKKSGGGSTRPVDGKTGNPVLDALDADQRTRVLNGAYTEQNRELSERRAALGLRVENASAALLETGEYAGPMPTRREFAAAYPNDPVQGEIAWREFEAAQKVGENIAAFKSLSAAEITAKVEALRPTDTASPSFAVDMKGFQAAETAAKTIIKQRDDDPAGYARRHFPTVQAAAQAVEQAPPEQRAAAQQALTASVNAAYETMGLPANQRSPLPKATADAVVEKFKDTNLKFDERVNALAATVLSTNDPAQRTQIFEQMVRSDNSLAKFQAAIEAQARGDNGAARRLFQAGMVDPDKTPIKSTVTAEEIKLAIAERVMGEGQIGDTTYGFTDNVAGGETRAVRDGALFTDAVKFQLAANGDDLDAAIDQVTRDIYGKVNPVRATNVNAVVPEGVDAREFVKGAQASTALVREQLASLRAGPREGEDPGAAAVRTAMNDIYLEEVVDNGVWRSAAGGYAFFDTASGLPVPGPDGKPLVVSLEQIMSAAARAPARDGRATQKLMRAPWGRE